MCLTKRVEEKNDTFMLFFLPGGYMKGSLKGSVINFQDFHFQGIIQACPIFTPLF